VQGPENSPAISRLLDRLVIAEGAARAATSGYVGLEGPPVVGAAGRLPEAPAGIDTWFDLASVSKSVVACAAARLADRGRLSLSQPLGDVLPAARGTRTERMPIELLLAHRAGLEGHRALFAPVFAGRPICTMAALRDAADARRADCPAAPPPEGFPPVYSDLGYALVGAALEQVASQPLDLVIQREVSEPLGLRFGSARLLRRLRPQFDDEVAPTETLRARGGALRGVVHDENAWALTGHGCSGHAGLFGTIDDVLRFGQALLVAHAGQSAWLRPDALWTLIRPRPGGSLRAGFDGKSEAGSSAGASASPETFGHLGFTGTSLWCDPTAGTAVALLTNRVCPTRDNPRLRSVRPRMHDALFEAAKALLPRAPDP